MKTTRQLIGLFLASASLAAPGLAGDETLRARGLFVAGATDAMQVLVLKAVGDEDVPVDPGQSFTQNDRIRISFRSNFDGYVYVVNVMPSGKKRVIFPYSVEGTSDFNNRVQRDRLYAIPSTQYFTFDAERGVEVLQVLMSREPIDLLDAAARTESGWLGETAASAASELSGGVTKPGIAVDGIALVLPTCETGAVRARRVILSPGKERDRNGSYVAIPDDKGTPARLNSGEVAVFELRLAHQ